MKLFCLFTLILMLAGCRQMELTGFVKMPEKLSEQRFNGKFSLDVSGSVYGRGSYTYKFNGTTYAVLETSQSYASGYRLSIEVSDGRVRSRLWDNKYSNWASWETYRFDEPGDLWLENLEYKKR